MLASFADPRHERSIGAPMALTLTGMGLLRGGWCWWGRCRRDPHPLPRVVDSIAVEHVLPRRVDHLSLDRFLNDHGRRRLHYDGRGVRIGIVVRIRVVVGVVVRIPRPGGKDSHTDEGLEPVVVVPEAPVVAMDTTTSAAMPAGVGRCGGCRQECRREHHGADHGAAHGTRASRAVQLATARCAWGGPSAARRYVSTDSTRACPRGNRATSA